MNVVGVDAHKHSHTLVALDHLGAKQGEKTVKASSSGHLEAMQWVRTKLGDEVVWGVEDQRSATLLLERELLAAQHKVVRVPPHYMARNRGAARAWGKSDPIDALAVARAVLQHHDLPLAVHDAFSWELKLLVDRREDLVGHRVDAMNRMFVHLHQLDPERAKPTKLDHDIRRRALHAYLTEQPGLLADIARQELDDISYFSMSIDHLTKEIAARVHHTNSGLLSLPGCAEITAAKLIAETANMDRFRSEAAFARYAGLAPVPRWSGSTKGRSQASRSGNRQCNTAIHRIAVVQIRMAGPGRTYYQRRLTEGDAKGNAIRSLKRRIGRTVYNLLLADYQKRNQQPPSTHPAEDTVGGTPAWIHADALASGLHQQAADDRGGEFPGAAGGDEPGCEPTGSEDR
ncbi:IS110 family transposase [Mycolicibacterium neoaurum]|uniref:IS110 family transposase n=1 Tax=Mycolicibacterium neoaurum TaxID=1795 RepID=UPI001F4D0DEA|nr:IS110 family transposase [Mycolicibacterium neoaurum]